MRENKKSERAKREERGLEKLKRKQMRSRRKEEQRRRKLGKILLLVGRK